MSNQFNLRSHSRFYDFDLLLFRYIVTAVWTIVPTDIKVAVRYEILE